MGSSKVDIIRSTKNLILDKNKYNEMAETLNPYGDGFASNKIIYNLEKMYE